MYGIDCERVGVLILYPSSQDRLDVFLSLGGNSGGVECLLDVAVLVRLVSFNDEALLGDPRASSRSTPVSKFVDMVAMLRGWYCSSLVASSLDVFRIWVAPPSRCDRKVCLRKRAALSAMNYVGNSEAVRRLRGGARPKLDAVKSAYVSFTVS